MGLRRPRKQVLGNTMSGTVVALGPGVTDLVEGDEVCGMLGARMGGHAELVAVDAARLARKPASVSHDDAAAVLFGGSTALHFLRDKAGLRPGQRLLVNGASGAVGTNAVQLGKYLGATVTAVTSGANTDLARALGADEVIDYTTSDLADQPERWDVVLDAVGTITVKAGRALLRKGGVLLLASADLPTTLRARGNVKAGMAPERPADFDLLLRLVSDRTLTSVIDRIVAMDDIAAAYERVDSGRKVGNVLVRPGSPIIRSAIPLARSGNTPTGRSHQRTW